MAIEYMRMEEEGSAYICLDTGPVLMNWRMKMQMEEKDMHMGKPICTSIGIVTQMHIEIENGFWNMEQNVR